MAEGTGRMGIKINNVNLVILQKNIKLLINSLAVYSLFPYSKVSLRSINLHYYDSIMAV